MTNRLRQKWLGAALAISMTYPIVSLAKDEAVVIEEARQLKVISLKRSCQAAREQSHFTSSIRGYAALSISRLDLDRRQKGVVYALCEPDPRALCRPCVGPGHRVSIQDAIVCRQSILFHQRCLPR